MRGIVYIHAPKCGGSSFGAALRLRHLTSQATINLRRSRAAVPAHLTGEDAILADYAARDAELARLVARGTRCISAHVRFDPRLPDMGYACVTLLRDPAERFVSHYRYLQRRHPDPDRAPTLEAFLETPDAARLASQYLFYFAGCSQARAPDLPAAIARAQGSLRRFALVGNLGDTAGFARDLRQLTGGPLPRLRRNQAPAPTRVPAALRPRIEQLCAPDYAIYHSVFPQAATPGHTA